jgi:hypothetical protein
MSGTAIVLLAVLAAFAWIVWRASRFIDRLFSRRGS